MTYLYKRMLKQADESNVLEFRLHDSSTGEAGEQVQSAYREAARRLSPMWDVRDYVAVNPLFGMRDKPFLEVIEYVKRTSGVELLPSNSFFAKKYASGAVLDSDLELAIQLFKKEEIIVPKNLSSAELLRFVDDSAQEAQKLPLLSVSDVYDYENQASTTDEITNQVSKWAAAYFDEGQALWKMPTDGKRLYGWWKSLVTYDSSLKKQFPNFDSIVKSLPSSPEKALEVMAHDLLESTDLSQAELTHYFYRLMVSVMGWSSFVQRFEFEAERSGDKSELRRVGGLTDLVAMRMAYDISLLAETVDSSLLKSKGTEEQVEQSSLLRYLWLNATEFAYKREVASTLQEDHVFDLEPARPLAQMAFCIDVRSEVIRRHIERESDRIQTIGFAGFFGMSISKKGLGHVGSDPQCPILLNPVLEVGETAGGSPENLAQIKSQKAQGLRAQKKIQFSGNSAFSFAETIGFSYIYKLLKMNQGRNKPNTSHQALGLSETQARSVSLDLTQVSLDEKVSMAQGALVNMGLTENFAKQVFFFGHGSESSNNPFASALDCGACAGHNGHDNARCLAEFLNDRAVRAELSKKNIAIPEDTIFVSGWHNTTRDALNFDRSGLEKNDRQEDLQEILGSLDSASERCRKERAESLEFCDHRRADQLQRDLSAKANDWSEVRPEWGLARNAAFIVGRRAKTRGLDFRGRSFLHDYDEAKDDGLKTLELIMTAPMIVTNWINMQYYASTIDPVRFGAGNKVINNVTGTIGCIQGNEGDLAGGLTEQSVRHKGQYFHEPLRLQVFIEAKTQSIESIIKRHQMVTELVENQWLKIIAIDPESQKMKTYHNRNWIAAKEEVWNS